MSQMKDQAKLPLHLTYRAVGSTTGQFEHLGVDNPSTNSFEPYSYFGSGDIPIPTANYELLKSNGKDMVHLPVLLGAISVFHSIPNVGDGELNVTSCLLSRIFGRKVTMWDDEEVLDLNPNLKDKLPYTNYPIRVARRVKGSSSTKSITKYLHSSCPNEWPEEMVGSVVNWDTSTDPCEGSGGMTTCIKSTAGTIGYIDAGHGHEEKLIEVDLMNRDGVYLSSKSAAQSGGIGAAAVSIPGSADEDFGPVNLLNQPGEYTWPIVAMSYVYVRKDLSQISNPAEKTLLEYFLRSLYDSETIGQCAQFGFTPVPEYVRKVGLDGIDMIEFGDGPKWDQEVATNPGVGMGEYVISAKRRSFDEYERSLNTMTSKRSITKVEELEASSPQALMKDGDEDDQNSKIGRATTLGWISIGLWALTAAYLVATKMGHDQQKVNY